VTQNITPEQLLELSSSYNLIPVFQTIPLGQENPVSLFEKLALDVSGSFLLESAEQGIWSRYSFIGVHNRGSLLKYSDGKASWISTDGASPFPDRPASQLVESALGAIEQVGSSWHSPRLANLPPLTSGLVGLLGWDLIREIEHLPNAPKADYKSPLMSLSMSAEMAIVDHELQVIHLLSNVFIDAGTDPTTLYSNAIAKIEGMKAKLTNAVIEPAPASVQVGERTSRISKPDFFESVAKAKEYVKIGDVFQVVLSQRFDIETNAQPIEIYRHLRELNPSPYMYLLNFEDASGRYAVVGSSPEALVTVNDGHAVMHPIAGSRPRGANDVEDQRLSEELIADHKERAEHLMLVDLARNDLLKVCLPDSVQVSEFMQIHRFSHIMHLNSTVEGTVISGKSPVDVFRATFPAGTLSGAPKPRALEIIDELEPANRGAYAGVVGYFDFYGNADLAIAIRTAFVRDGVAHVQAGAGIVLDSVDETEFQETISKANAPIRAIEACAKNE
jgi:anthranilate synthase component 1